MNLTKTSTVHLDFNPYAIGANNDGANLDIKVDLLNSAKQVIRSYNPTTILNVVIDTVLSAGTYYLMVDGTSNNNASDYGSLGSYTISGTAVGLTVAPIHSVALGGSVTDSKHNLNWNIISDERVKNVVVEYSANGINFRDLSIVDPTLKKFGYNPFDRNDTYYRLRVTSVTNQVAYSNVIMLKGINTKKNFIVSTFVTNEIKINAADTYDFSLFDINGKMVMKGNRNAGFNSETTYSLANGMYVMQILSHGIRTIERIIKQ